MSATAKQSQTRRLAILALWDLAVASYTQPTPDPEAIDLALKSVGLNFHAVAFGGSL